MSFFSTSLTSTGFQSSWAKREWIKSDPIRDMIRLWSPPSRTFLHRLHSDSVIFQPFLNEPFFYLIFVPHEQLKENHFQTKMPICKLEPRISSVGSTQMLCHDSNIEEINCVGLTGKHHGYFSQQCSLGFKSYFLSFSKDTKRYRVKISTKQLRYLHHIDVDWAYF